MRAITRGDILPQLPEALLDPAAYPHPVHELKLIETHLSWVFLTGEFVYKVKKPVHFDFVDFSTPELREHFCREEVRCNRAFAPELYLGVVPLRLAGDGLAVGTEGDPATEYAVKMRQFDGALQADHLLARDELTTSEMRDFGARLALQHAQLPELDAVYDPGAAIVENFTTLSPLACVQPFVKELQTLRRQAEMDLANFAEYLQTRNAEHFVKECHGDLHLSNLARLEHGITAFDCLEFDQSLRHIDVWCDAGFLFMDCCIRDRADLAYAFVDGYLDTSGDYDGVRLLPMFAAYRSVVRAKIAALRYEQAAEPEARAKLEQHLQWPLQQHARGVGTIFVTCGLSGSGKSHWAKQLLARLPALRLRSDVLRKTQHGLAPLDSSGSDIGEGLYTPTASTDVYTRLAEHGAELAQLGEHVLVDAACLQLAQREAMYKAAERVGAAVKLLYFTAPKGVLLERIQRRNAAAADPSEADATVLDWQIDHAQLPSAAEPVVEIDTTATDLETLIARIG